MNDHDDETLEPIRPEPYTVFLRGGPPTPEELASHSPHDDRYKVEAIPGGLRVEDWQGKSNTLRVLCGAELEEQLFQLHAWCTAAHPYEEHTHEEVLAATKGFDCVLVCDDAEYREDTPYLDPLLSGLGKARQGLWLTHDILYCGERDALAIFLRYDPEDDDLLRDEDPLERPLPSKVARRALVLLAVSQRGHAERAPRARATKDMAKLRAWLDRHGLTAELEPQEREMLAAPIGSLNEGLAFEAAWRIEAAAVLAWGLERFELPEPGDVDPDALFEALGFEGDARVLVRPRLRPERQLEALSAETMSACFEMIAGAPADPTPEEVKRATALRHRSAAVHWLLGILESLGSLTPDPE